MSTYTDPSESLALILRTMGGIALVRPALPVDNIDVVKYLHQRWAMTTPSVEIVVANASESGIEITMAGIVGRSPLTASVDIMPLPQWQPIQSASTILARWHSRIDELILRLHPSPVPTDRLVAVIDDKQALVELARRVMFELNLEMDFLHKASDFLDRPGDGLIIDRHGNITDMPVIPRCLKHEPVLALG